jgi:dynactin 1
MFLFCFQRKLEDVQLMLKRKEKEFNETIEHLQSDMTTLEKEKAELKEKLMHSSKKTLLEGLTKSTTSAAAPFLTGAAAAASQSAAAVAAATAAATSASSVSSSVRDSPLLISEIAQLREALRITQSEKNRLVADDLRAKVESLKPLQLPNRNVPVTEKSAELNKLIRQAEELKMVTNLFIFIMFMHF